MGWPKGKPRKPRSEPETAEPAQVWPCEYDPFRAHAAGCPHDPSRKPAPEETTQPAPTTTGAVLPEMISEPDDEGPLPPVPDEAYPPGAEPLEPPSDLTDEIPGQTTVDDHADHG